MSQAPVTTVPDESAWLCEGCGYVLSGLPPGGRCPECGKLTSESDNQLRQPPLWERPDAPRVAAFFKTSWDVLFHTSRFYRSLATRGSREPSLRFAQIHWGIASVLFGIAAWLHFDWASSTSTTLRIGDKIPWWGAIILSVGAFAFLWATIRIAAWLTSLEANYRGYRMPLKVVQRGLDYHAAHYLPVALVAAMSVLSYRVLAMYFPTKSADWGMKY